MAVLAMISALTFLSAPDLSAAEEPQWVSLLPAIRPQEAGVAGEWKLSSDTLSVNAVTGGRLMLPVAPTGEYDLRVSFTRKDGRHSVGAVVVHGGKQVAFELDAWGMHLAGFQNLNGQTIQQNATRREGMQLENGKRYLMTIEVRKDRLRALLDGKELANHATDGRDLTLSNLWTLPDTKRLGLVAWESATDFHAVEIRAISGGPIALLDGKPATVAGTTPPRSTRPNPAPTTPANPTTPAATGKRVLIVIANGDFFYREYADPRAELERRGIRVTVGAGRVAASRPHSGSGEGSDGGVVTPDVALKDVKASDFDAILFSGGWGASMYQFAFTGRYDNASYNGDRATKAEVNRVINEFVAQDKYVCGLCNAVSVLAWARVDGRSPLAGKRVCAPARQAPTGVYNGQRGQPSCRWHPEQNQARMSPFQSIGQPNSSADDVIVDGKIITGEDDASAREMGRTLANVLLN